MTIENSGSIREDEPVDQADDGEFDAENAFLKSFDGAEDETSESPSEAGEKDTSETGEETPPAETGDDPEFDIKVGEETRKAKLSELTRLYGQEASLTQKSQAVAQLRAEAEAHAQRAQAALHGAVERAQKAWEPYSKLDFLVLATQMNPDDLAALRTEARAAYDNLNYLTSELDGVTKGTQERQATLFRERASATIAELSDPDKGIKGWGPDLYGEMMTYATSVGLPEAAAKTIVEAPALRILHKAMLYDRAQAEAAKLKTQVTKVTPKVDPKKVIKPGAATDAEDGPKSRSAVVRQLREAGGGLDATAAAFLAIG